MSDHVVQMASDNDQFYFVKDDGSLWCWGTGGMCYGLGGPIAQGNPGPMSIGGTPLTGIAEVASAGTYYLSLRRTNGDVEFLRSYGGITLTPRVTDARKIAGGYFQTCALKNDDSVYCWDFDGYGANLTTPTRMTFATP